MPKKALLKALLAVRNLPPHQGSPIWLRNPSHISDLILDLFLRICWTVGGWALARFRTDLASRYGSRLSTNSGSCQNFFMASSFEEAIFSWRLCVDILFQKTFSPSNSCLSVLPNWQVSHYCWPGGVWFHQGSKQAECTPWIQDDFVGENNNSIPQMFSC